MPSSRERWTFRPFRPDIDRYRYSFIVLGAFLLEELMDSLPTDSDLPADIWPFVAHWQSAVKDTLVPTLSDYLDLPAVPYQRDTAIVDILDTGQIRYRLFGSGLNDLFGIDLTGSEVLSHFQPAAQEEAERIMRVAVSRPCGYVLRRHLRRGPLEVTAVGVGLPLRNAQRGHSCIVGFTSNIARQTEFAPTEEKFFVAGVTLIRWLDIGAGIP